MQAKRKLAENRFEVGKSEEVEKEDSKEIVTEIPSLTEVNNIQADNDKELEEEYITLNVVEDEKGETHESLVEDELEKNMSNPNNNEQQQIEYIAKKTGVVSDININKIVIKKVEKPEMPKRITYYLRPETIKKIDKFSKASGMGKSEFVQKILDEVLNNLEIEK